MAISGIEQSDEGCGLLNRLGEALGLRHSTCIPQRQVLIFFTRLFVDRRDVTKTEACPPGGERFRWETLRHRIHANKVAEDGSPKHGFECSVRTIINEEQAASLLNAIQQDWRSHAERAKASINDGEAKAVADFPGDATVAWRTRETVRVFAW